MDEARREQLRRLLLVLPDDKLVEEMQRFQYRRPILINQRPKFNDHVKDPYFDEVIKRYLSIR